MPGELHDIIASMVAAEVARQLAQVRPANANAAEAGATLGPTAEYIDDRVLAEWIGLSRETLQQMRQRAEGPPWIKVARRAVRYHTPSVRTWLASQSRGSNAAR